MCRSNHSRLQNWNLIPSLCDVVKRVSLELAQSLVAYDNVVARKMYFKWSYKPAFVWKARHKNIGCPRRTFATDSMLIQSPWFVPRFRLVAVINFEGIRFCKFNYVWLITMLRLRCFRVFDRWRCTFDFCFHSIICCLIINYVWPAGRAFAQSGAFYRLINSIIVGVSKSGRIFLWFYCFLTWLMIWGLNCCGAGR